MALPAFNRVAFHRARRTLGRLRGNWARPRPQSNFHATQTKQAPVPVKRRRDLFKDPRPRKWLLLYNCHFLGLANCLHLLSDEIEVEAYRPNAPGRFKTTPSQKERQEPIWKRPLDQYERILVFPCFVKKWAHLGLSERDNVVELPAIYFNGFHPDFCHIQSRPASSEAAGRVAPQRHSLIGAVAFQAGLNLDQALALFNEEVYERLGYFDCWEPAREHLVAKFAQAGFDIREAFLAWSRQGLFMHTVGHPQIHCLRDLALILLNRFEATISPCSILPADSLVQTPVDPLYPELGRRLGVPGSYLFKPGGSYQTYSLRGYLEARFDDYRSLGPFELAPGDAHLQPAADALREIIA